jgi:type IV secretion system protein VirB6
MTLFCPAPDASQGIALRLSTYVSCEARALGENGFQALAGGPLGTSLLSGLVTIFIALIGYRLILGHTPNIRDGVGWTVRLGIVLALVTSWPAFETLVFRVAVDGPGELAKVLLPASGLPSTDLSGRVQSAYDTMRLGTMDTVAAPASGSGQNANSPGAQPAAGSPRDPNSPAPPQQFKFQSPLPNTASILVISTSGVIAALQIAIGFLLAVGPLAMMSLLFDGTSSLFNGWLRALAGAALTMLGATVVTAIDLVMVESELGRLENFRLSASPTVIDPQALTTIVALFAFVMIIMVFASMRMASALKLPSRWGYTLEPRADARAVEAPRLALAHGSSAAMAPHLTDGLAQNRVAAVVEVLAKAVGREQLQVPYQHDPSAPARHSRIAEATERSIGARSGSRVGLGNRRRENRRTRTAARRDQRS